MATVGVWLLGRHGDVTRATIVALLVLAILFVCLAIASRTSRPRWVPVPLVLAAWVAVVPAHFFGPNSAFAAVIALTLIALGLLSRTEDSGVSHLWGWLVYASLAAGQALAFALALTGTIADRSLVVVVIPGHPDWHHAMAHATVQGIYLGAFLLGRALRRRYVELAGDLEQAHHRAVTRRALLAEARLEYRGALEAARQGILTGRVVGRYRVGDLRARDDTSEVYDGVDIEDGTGVTLRLSASGGLGVERPVPEASAGEPVADPGQPRPVAISGLAESLPLVVRPHARLSLADVIARDGRLDTSTWQPMMAAVADALAADHARSRFHLEVRPEAIVGEFDLGDTRWSLESSAAVGPSAAVLRFAAPERFRGPFADHRADVYGLAASVYHAATGRAPFDDLDAAALQLDRGLPRAPDVAEPVAAVLRIALSPDPEDRFASIELLRRALDEACEGRLAADLEGRSRALESDAPWREAEAAPSAPDAPEPAMEHAVPESVWQQAYRDKMHLFVLGVTGLCAGGAGLFAVIIRHPVAKFAALAGFACIVAAAWLHRVMLRSRPNSYWPWAVVSLVSAGPAYAIGFNTGFAAAVAVLLFAGGLFQAAQEASWLERRGAILLAACGGVAALMVLILVGVVPDHSNVELRQPGAPMSETLALSGALLAIYVLAFVAGRSLDRRYERLAIDARLAASDAAHQGALLTDARADIERVQMGEGVGLFSALQLGDYALRELLGRGGMGEVYAATDVRSGASAALKVLRADRVADPTHLDRFRREAEALGQIESPFVARVIEVGGFRDGLPFIAMEYIEGRVLAELLAAEDRLRQEAIRALVADIGAGLIDVHRADIIHRDIKPQNIILTTEGADSRWKLVDFGIAAIGETDDPGDLIMGTPRYMSPEQAAGDSLDARSDLFSLCLVVYRALTGCPAFTGNRPSEVTRAHRDIGIPRPGAFVLLDEDLEFVLRIGTARAPADRFQSATALRDAFEDAFAGHLGDDLRRRGRRQLDREPWA